MDATVNNATLAEVASPEEAPLYTFGLPWPELNQGLSYADVVRSNGNPATTLIDFYSSKYNHSAPLQGWIQRIRNGQITINGEVVTDPATILSDGSKLVYHRLPWKEPPTPYELHVLYEDDHMVAINKPSGLQVLPGGLFQQRTVLMQLQWKKWSRIMSCSKAQAVQESYPVPVHRLGRGTSGILLCAKTKIAKTRLAAYFAKGTAEIGDVRCETETCKERSISKYYRALVIGLPENDEITIKQPIGLMHYPGIATGLYVATTSGKPAMSKVYVLERDAQRNQTLVQVEIHTGRPHQIRIHLAFIGHPLIGDPLYDIGGKPRSFGTEFINDNHGEDGGYQKPLQPVPGDCGYFLHAHQLLLYHPITSERIEMTAPPPTKLLTHEEHNYRVRTSQMNYT